MTKVSVAAAGDTAAASPHEFHPPDKYGACNALNFCDARTYIHR